MGHAVNELLPELTSFIEGLAEPRILMDLDYRILAANKAYRDAFAAHESVVGRRCYEVSHHYTRPCDEAGESCPRRSALASRRAEHVLHIHHTPRGDEHVQVELNPVRDSSGEIRFLVERMQSLPTARAGTFRSDLYYRISAFPIHVPTLRERRDDILLLAESLLGRIRPGQAFSLDEDARRALFAYDYPGNVRELRNIIERATLLASDGVIRMHHLPEEVVPRDASAAAGVCDTVSAPGEISVRALDRQTLAHALEQHRCNRRDLAASLGISERTLYRRLREFGLARRTVSAR